MVMGGFEVDSEKKEKSTVTGEFGIGLCTWAAGPELGTKTMRHTELANLNAWPSRALVVQTAMLFDTYPPYREFPSCLTE
jgi:hypothetical protein